MEFLLFYVGDVLCVLEHPEKIMETIKIVYHIK